MRRSNGIAVALLLWTLALVAVLPSRSSADVSPFVLWAILHALLVAVLAVLVFFTSGSGSGSPDDLSRTGACRASPDTQDRFLLRVMRPTRDEARGFLKGLGWTGLVLSLGTGLVGLMLDPGGMVGAARYVTREGEDLETIIAQTEREGLEELVQRLWSRDLPSLFVPCELGPNRGEILEHTLEDDERARWLASHVSCVAVVQIRDGVLDLTRPLSSEPKGVDLFRHAFSEVIGPIEAFSQFREATQLLGNDERLADVLIDLNRRMGTEFATTVSFELGVRASLSWALSAREAAATREYETCPRFRDRCRDLAAFLRRDMTSRSSASATRSPPEKRNGPRGGRRPGADPASGAGSSS